MASTTARTKSAPDRKPAPAKEIDPKKPVRDTRDSPSPHPDGDGPGELAPALPANENKGS